MTKEQLIIVLVILVVLVFLLGIFLVIYTIRKKKNRDSLKDDNQSSDNYLQRGIEYTVLKDSDFTPGRYQITTDGVRDKYINIRITGFIKEFKRNSFVVLDNNDKITALSESVILKKKEKKNGK
ncbi:hypothetical protein LJC17_01150 [Acholeplasma sp. OttesenSCG-928-E16]|nr:hypothetical protein [Acholeplasma sp. OttesenSCG-928-E16]